MHQTVLNARQLLSLHELIMQDLHTRHVHMYVRIACTHVRTCKDASYIQKNIKAKLKELYLLKHTCSAVWCLLLHMHMLALQMSCMQL